MYFTKDEIIELNDGKSYLILDTALLDDKFYFKAKEVDSSYEKVTGDSKILTAIKRGDKLLINDKITFEEQEKLQELFS